MNEAFITLPLGITQRYNDNEPLDRLCEVFGNNKLTFGFNVGRFSEEAYILSIKITDHDSLQTEVTVTGLIGDTLQIYEKVKVELLEREESGAVRLKFTS